MLTVVGRQKFRWEEIRFRTSKYPEQKRSPLKFDAAITAMCVRVCARVCVCICAVIKNALDCEGMPGSRKGSRMKNYRDISCFF